MEHLLPAVFEVLPINCINRLSRCCDRMVLNNGKEMTRYLAEISWETEVWVADQLDHIIHFNGDRFLEPYEQPESRS